MGMQYGAGSYRASWSWSRARVRTRDRADFEAVCWFVALGLSMTALLCVLGYTVSIGQALAISG
jgi:hypothetical protein